MKATIVRQPSTSKQTLGHFTLLDDAGVKIFECETLELPWKNNQRQISCIPQGTYKVVLRYSAKYGHHFHVTDVTGRSYILIHAGNFYKDILGCILVGAKHIDIDGDGNKDVTSSKATLKKLLALAPNGFELTIQ